MEKKNILSSLCKPLCMIKLYTLKNKDIYGKFLTIGDDNNVKYISVFF